MGENCARNKSTDLVPIHMEKMEYNAVQRYTNFDPMIESNSCYTYHHKAKESQSSQLI